MEEERQLVHDMVSNEITDTNDIPSQISIPLELVEESE